MLVFSNYHLCCVWMRQFNEVINLFEEIEMLWSKMTCLDEEIKRKLKPMNFKKVF